MTYIFCFNDFVLDLLFYLYYTALSSSAVFYALVTSYICLKVGFYVTMVTRHCKHDYNKNVSL